jgi:hypothetical protein
MVKRRKAEVGRGNITIDLLSSNAAAIARSVLLNHTHIFYCPSTLMFGALYLIQPVYKESIIFYN